MQVPTSPREAIESSSPRMGTSIPERQLFIGGKWVQPAKKERFDVLCPHDESVIGSIPLATKEDVDAAVAAALAAKGAWGKTTGAFRASFLRKIASKASCAAPNAESCPALPRCADDAWCMMMRSPGIYTMQLGAQAGRCMRLCSDVWSPGAPQGATTIHEHCALAVK